MSNRAFVDLGNWMGLEQTPKLEETPELFPDPFEPDPEPTGNTTSCYLCGRSFHQLPGEYIIRRDYQYNLDPKSKKAHRERRYFMTFCVWCAHSHKL